MFLSLKWKAISLVVIILVTLSGFLIFLNSSHLEALTEQQQHQSLEKLRNQLSGVLVQSYRRNLQLIDLLPAMARHQGDNDTATLPPLAQTLRDNWATLQLNWGIELINLYDLNGNPIWRSDQTASEISINLDSDPNWTINCLPNCRQVITSPIIDKSGNAYYIKLEISTADLLIDFKKISETDIGILSPVSPTNNSLIYNLANWNKSIKLMTNPGTSLDILQTLERQIDFSSSLKSIHKIKQDDKTYEILVTAIGTADDVFFVILMDVSDTQLMTNTAQWSLIVSAISGILISCLILLIMLWQPITRLRRQSEILPLLISERFKDALFRLNKNRSQHWLKDEIDTLNDTEEEVCRQLSEMRIDINKKATRLHNMAMFDSLTELSNRRAFMQYIQEALEGDDLNQKPFALLFIDLDDFKRVNDSLGHNAGDELLKIVAKRLHSCVRGTDVIARLGGDEFCIILHSLKNPSDSGIVADNILKTLRNPISLNSNELIVSASIGIVRAPEDGNSSQTLLQNADIAMYKAKSMGRNKYQHFNKMMTENLVTKLSMESELRKAIKYQEFVLHYQPQIDLQSQKIFGFETLIRWQHPEKGLLYPDTFIGILEETGLIVEVGNWVVEESCRQLREWLNKDLPVVRLALNISPRQLQEDDLGKTISDTVAKYRLNSSFIELEVTESLIMDDMELTQNQLSNLRDMGFTIAIDDFGTGHSSLSYLKALPLDILKIDRSFVQDLTYDSDDQEIVSAIIAMAHKLNLKVIAEGVETNDHQDLLRLNQCDYTQGYFYSRPISSSKAETLMIQQHQSFKATPRLNSIAGSS